MARKRLRDLIDLSPLRDAWLVDAELSIPMTPVPTSAGLSVFLRSSEDASAFLEAASAPTSIAALETTLRRDLPLSPRRWFKLAYEHARPVAIAHYFQIDPRVGYPIATIRHFLRATGTPSPDTLERALAPELDDPRVVWGLVARHPVDGSALHMPRAKVSVAVSPSRVERLVTRLFGPALAHDAARIAGLGASHVDEVFVTFTPGRSDSLQIDVTAPVPADLPCRFTGLGVGWPLDRPLAYAKWRAADPTWTAYARLDAYASAERAFQHEAGDRDRFDRAQDPEGRSA